MALVECGTGKSRSARLRLVPMHSFLLLSPSSAFSRPLVSLSLSLSFSLGPRPFLFFSRPLDLSLLVFLSRPLRSLAQTHCSAPLRARRLISFLSCLSYFSVHTRTYDTHAPQTKISPLYSLTLFLSLSLFLLPPLSHLSLFLFQIPLYPARAHTRIRGSFPFFLFLRATLPLFPLPDTPSRSLTRACTYICARTLVHAIDVGTLFVSSSLSRAHGRISARTSLHTSLGTEPSRLVLFLDFLLLLVEHAPLTELHLVAAGKASSWHLNRSTHARRATLLRIRPRK